MKTSTRKKILFLITKSNWGGAQRYVYDLATHLDHKEFEVAVALGGEGALAKELASADIRVIHLQAMKNETSLVRITEAVKELRTVCRKESPDFLHVNSSLAGVSGAIAGRMTQVPKIIFTAHGWAFNEDRSIFQRIVLKSIHWLTVLLTHHTIAVSHAIKKQLDWPLVARKMIVIHNGRATPDFLNREAARTICSERVPALLEHSDWLWTGTIGELHPVKRHDLMINAIAVLKRRGIDICHIIIGEGSERDRLETLIRERNVADRVFLLGHVHEAATLLKAFDIFVLPSRSEALAYVAIEAAQAGLPIIASRVGGIPEIITHQRSGLLFTSGSLPELTESLTHLISNEQLRQRVGIRAKVQSENFSIEQMIAKTGDLYRS